MSTLGKNPQKPSPVSRLTTAAAVVAKSYASIRRVRPLYGLLVVLLVSGPALRAQQNADDLRHLARNPMGDAVKVPFTESVNLDSGPYDRNSSSLQIEPFLSLQIAGNWLLIPRIATPPVVYQPDLAQEKGGITGIGDSVATFFISPAHTRRFIWGIGPSLLIPTATNAKLGGGVWELGASFGVVTQPDWGSAYVVVQNLTSLPGKSRESTADLVQIETSLSYYLRHNWYLITSPTLNADFSQPRGNRWLVPFGGGIGRTIKIDNHAFDFNVALYFLAIRPTSQPAPKWQINMQFTWIHPRLRK